MTELSITTKCVRLVSSDWEQHQPTFNCHMKQNYNTFRAEMEKFEKSSNIMYGNQLRIVFADIRMRSSIILLTVSRHRQGKVCFRFMYQYYVLFIPPASSTLCWQVGCDVTARRVSALVLLSRLDYCNAILAGLPMTTLLPLQRVLNAVARIVFGVRPLLSGNYTGHC